MTDKEKLKKWPDAAEEIMKYMDYMPDDKEAKMKLIISAVTRALT